MICELIKKTLDLSIKKHWLKTIDREANRYNRLINRANIQARVVHSIVNKYNGLYPEDALEIKR